MCGSIHMTFHYWRASVLTSLTTSICISIHNIYIQNIICIHPVCKRLHYYCERINFGLDKSNVRKKTSVILHIIRIFIFFSLSLAHPLTLRYIYICIILCVYTLILHILIHLFMLSKSLCTHYVVFVSTDCIQAIKRSLVMKCYCLCMCANNVNVNFAKR